MTAHPVKESAPDGSAVYLSTNARPRAAVLAGRCALLAATAVVVAVPLGFVPARQLLLGGALTAAVLGLAARPVLADLVAGVVLRRSRTVAVGDRIRLHNGNLGGIFEGTVADLGRLHLRLRTADAPLVVPYAQVRAGAVARLHPEAAQPTAQPYRRPLSAYARRRHPVTHTKVLRTTRLMPARTPSGGTEESGGAGPYGGGRQGGVPHREASAQRVDGGPDRVEDLGSPVG
jgi:hypothetical protein